MGAGGRTWWSPSRCWPAPARRRSARRTVAVIGDSITFLSADDIQAGVGRRRRPRALTGRIGYTAAAAGPGRGLVRGPAPAVVLFELGTNDVTQSTTGATSAAGFEQAMSGYLHAFGDACLIATTVSSHRSRPTMDAIGPGHQRLAARPLHPRGRLGRLRVGATPGRSCHRRDGRLRAPESGWPAGPGSPRPGRHQVLHVLTPRCRRRRREACRAARPEQREAAHPMTPRCRRRPPGGSPTRGPSSQCRKWRSPVKTMARPAASAAAITLASPIDPPAG